MAAPLLYYYIELAYRVHRGIKIEGNQNNAPELAVSFKSQYRFRVKFPYYMHKTKQLIAIA